MWNYGIEVEYDPSKMAEPGKTMDIVWDLRKIIVDPKQDLRLEASVLYMYENENKPDLFAETFETKLQWEEKRRDDKIPRHFTRKPVSTVTAD